MKSLLLFLMMVLWSQGAFAANNYCTDPNTAVAYKFDEVSGTVMDCTSNGNNSSSVSGATQNVTGEYGQAIKFTNTTGQSVITAAATSVNNINPITICIWANNASFSSGGDYISSWIYSKAWRSKIFGFQPSGNLGYAVHTSDNEFTWTTTNNSVTTGIFQHLCVTYDTTTPSTSPNFYVNAVLQSSNSNSVSGTFDDDGSGGTVSGQIWLANEGNGANAGRLASTLDELLVYKGALSQSQISSEMSCGLDGTHCASNAVTTTFRGSTTKVLNGTTIY